MRSVSSLAGVEVAVEAEVVFVTDSDSHSD